MANIILTESQVNRLFKRTINEQTEEEEQMEYDYLYSEFSNAHKDLQKLSSKDPRFSSAKERYKNISKDLNNFKIKVNRKRLRIPEIKSVLRKHGITGSKDNSSQRIGFASTDSVEFYPANYSLTEFMLHTNKENLENIFNDLESRGIHVETRGGWTRGWGASAPGIEVTIKSDVPLLK